MLAKELRIPLPQLRVANAKSGMFDLTRLPIDEQERQAKLLGFAREGLRYVYTLNSNGLLRTLHQVPTEEDLLALSAHAASILWCTELWFYLERKPDAFMPAALEAHNATIHQLIDHPEQRERLGDRYVVYLRCKDCAPMMADVTDASAAPSVSAQVSLSCSCRSRTPPHRRIEGPRPQRTGHAHNALHGPLSDASIVGSQDVLLDQADRYTFASNGSRMTRTCRALSASSWPA
jgi:hypothetical protein